MNPEVEKIVLEKLIRKYDSDWYICNCGNCREMSKNIPLFIESHIETIHSEVISAIEAGIEIGKKQSIELEKHTADLYYEQGKLRTIKEVEKIMKKYEVRNLSFIEDIKNLKNSEAKK